MLAYGLGGAVLLGIGMLCVGLFVLPYEEQYACGSNIPTPQEIETRSVPSCLQTSVNGHTLCLKHSEDPTSEPPTWCASHNSYHLWWSPAAVVVCPLLQF